MTARRVGRRRSSPASGDDLGPRTAELTRYNARMAAPVADKQAAGRRAAEWFLPTSGRQLLFRRLALRTMQLPGLDRFLSSQLIAGAGGIP
jgi:hypothetical protein